MAATTRPGPGLLVTLGLLGLAAVWFYHGQNAAGHVGGAISLPKIFWLNFALSAFFVMPAFIWRDQRLDPALRFIFAVQFLNWIIRGIAELWLMYGIHAWIPPYGMYHGMFTVALLCSLQYRKRRLLATATTPVDRNVKRFLIFSMIFGTCEIIFAALFYRAVHFDTATTWFANGSSSFVFINRLTTVVDVFAYAALLLTVYRYYRPAAPQLVPAR
jgi:hypothetical protein